MFESFWQMFNQNLHFVLFWSHFWPIFGPNGQNWAKSVLYVHWKQMFFKYCSRSWIAMYRYQYLGPALAKIGPIGLNLLFLNYKPHYHSFQRCLKVTNKTLIKISKFPLFQSQFDHKFGTKFGPNGPKWVQLLFFELKTSYTLQMNIM